MSVCSISGLFFCVADCIFQRWLQQCLMSHVSSYSVTLTHLPSKVGGSGGLSSLPLSLEDLHNYLSLQHLVKVMCMTYEAGSLKRHILLSCSLGILALKEVSCHISSPPGLTIRKPKVAHIEREHEETLKPNKERQREKTRERDA